MGLKAKIAKHAANTRATTRYTMMKRRCQRLVGDSLAVFFLLGMRECYSSVFFTGSKRYPMPCTVWMKR